MRVPEDTFSRVVRNIAPAGRCFLWRGPKNAHGYGRIETPVGHRYVHRLVYEWTWGALERGQVVMHACDTPACVNPAHLRAGTQGDNARDMFRKGRNRHGVGPNALKTHCVKGHEFTTENTRISRDGWRYCRTCHRERNRKSA